MALIRLDETRDYLRVDSAFEDDVVGNLISAAIALCVDSARLSDSQWDDLNGEEAETDNYSKAEMERARGIMKIAVFFAVGYLFEHREEADHRELELTLRAILTPIRGGAF